MRIYPAESEEALRASKLLKDWAGEGLISKEQYARLKQETTSDLRTTNIFLRVVLFLFTLHGTEAAIGLFYLLFLTRAGQGTSGVLALLAGAACYAAAEKVAVRWRMYRHGVEEGLAAASVVCCCLGVLMLFDGTGPRLSPVVPVVGASLCLWIWHRFGLWYAFPAAMLFAAWLPSSWSKSQVVERIVLALVYGIGLAWITVARRGHRFDVAEEDYSLAEAFLWLGLYLCCNLWLFSLAEQTRWMFGSRGPRLGYPEWFYWATWVMAWCLPAVVLVRGIRLRDRFVMAVGGLGAVATFVCNKAYLGWPRHTWDPMILGVLLAGVAVYLRRWLAAGPDGVRAGFTAARLSGKDKAWMNLSSAALGLVTPQAVTPGAQPKTGDFHFGGGESGGGGASGEF